MNKFYKFTYVIPAVSLMAFTLDRYTKYLFINEIAKTKIVVKNFLIFDLHKNSGVAFGLLMNNYIYYFLFFIILTILFYLLYTNYKNKHLYLLSCLSFIIIGAISNFIDRIKYDAVVDFINVPFWSVFNLADCYIVGAVILWLAYIFHYERKKVSKKN